MSKFLDNSGLSYFWGKVKDWATGKFVAKETGKGLSANDYTTEEKQKLAGLSNVTVDAALSGTSTNPVQNAAVAKELAGKVDAETGKGLSSNDYTDEEKAKLAGLENVTVDSALSTTSTNPVQNKVVNAALEEKVPTSRTVNGKALTENITLGADDVSAIPAEQKGAAGGVAELDAAGKVPAAQLPSYVDDVIDAYVVSGATEFSAGWLSLTDGGAALTPESGKIYIVVSAGNYNLREFRWSGTTYGEVGKSITLGETSSTAYRGDRGKIAYDHSQAAHAPSDAQANVIEEIQVNGQPITPTGKTVNLDLSGYENEAITTEEIDAILVS